MKVLYALCTEHTAHCSSDPMACGMYACAVMSYICTPYIVPVTVQFEWEQLQLGQYIQENKVYHQYSVRCGKG